MLTDRALVHPTAIVHESAVIGADAQWRGRETKYDVLICEGVTVGPLTQIDAGCERYTAIRSNTQIMGHVHIGHGVRIGENCDIASGTVIAGEVTIGNGVRIGVNATITPYKTIGDGARIGAGAVVITHIPAYECWAGNPARFLYKLDPDTGAKLQEDIEMHMGFPWTGESN